MNVKEILGGLAETGLETVEKIGENSEALASAGKTTLQISTRTGLQLANGDIDQVAAERVVQRSFDQLKTLAVGEGNLVAAGLAGLWEQAIGAIFKLIPIIPKP